MPTFIINQTHQEAAKIHNSFMDAVVLPEMYASTSLELVIKELEAQLAYDSVIDPDDSDMAKTEITRAYLAYLKQI